MNFWDHLLTISNIVEPNLYNLNQEPKKLSSLNELLLTSILRLNLKEKDLAYRLKLAISIVSKYFITWICFLYHYLSEIDWMPSQGYTAVCFLENYPSTCIILDASEIFIETPSNLQIQSMWSNCKHHNTKFLVGCIPNGAISFYIYIVHQTLSLLVCLK